MGSGGSVQFQLTAEEAVDKKCAVKSTPGAMTTRSARPKTCFFCKHDVRRKRCYLKKCPEMPNLITPWHMLRRLFGFSSQKMRLTGFGP